MKLICDCGNKLEFIIDEENIQDEFGATYANDIGTICLSAEHDQLWIECKSCKKSIYIYT